MLTNIKAENMSVKQLASYIDYAILKPDYKEDLLEYYLQECVRYGCKMAAINPAALPLAEKITYGSATKIDVSCDFPLGQGTTRAKVLQADEYCKQPSVAELDFVTNFGWIRNHEWDKVKQEMKAIAEACHTYSKPVKAILETDALTLDEIKASCECAVEANIDYVKTSTGFLNIPNRVGPTPEVIQTMLDAVDGRIKVKASSCIHTQEQFFHLIDMGIDRAGIGCVSVPAVLGISATDYSKLLDKR